MALNNHGSGRGRQEGGSGEGSSPQRDDLPAYPQNYSYDANLTGSSPHALQTQHQGETPFIHTQDPTLPSDSQYGYGYQLQQSNIQYSNPWPGGFAADPSQVPGNNQVIIPQTAMDMTQHYPSPSPQPIPGGMTIRDNPANRTSGFARIRTMTSHPPTYQQYEIHPHFLQPHSPTPRQPTGLAQLPSPPRTSSSHSHPGTSLMQPDQPNMSRRVSCPFHQHNRNTSDPIPFTGAYSDGDSPTEVHPSFPTPSNGSSEGSNQVSYPQLTSYLGAAPPNPSGGVPYIEPQFSISSAPGKRKREAQGSPDVQPNKSIRKRRKTSQTDAPPVASSSRHTLDTPSPQVPSSPKNNRRKAPARGKNAIPQTPGQKKDAKRKVKERSDKNEQLNSILRLLPGSQPQNRDEKHLAILDRVIEHLQGDPVENVLELPPEQLVIKKDAKCIQNALGRVNLGHRYTRIRETLRGLGYNVPDNTSTRNVRQILIYVLTLLSNGVVNQELADFVQRFLGQNHPPGAPGP